MVSHAPHPPVHQYGLSFGCPRCQELALHPDQLDDDMRDRLLYGRLVTSLDHSAARTLRESIPHAFVTGRLVMSLCVLCGRTWSDPIHQEAV